MNYRCALFAAFVLALAPVALGQGSDASGIRWQEGPSLGSLGDVAEVRVPAGYIFANAKDTRRLMELMQNPVSGTEMGFIAPAGHEWFVVFEFDAVGYVRDDEKSTLDADAMLTAIKRGTEESNKERRRRGWPAMTIVGWEQEPRYNETTHNLEWAIRGESEGKPVINHNTRLLGRGGVMRVTLVAKPTILSSILPEYRSVLAGYGFRTGHGYSEFVPGDKVAKYGLTALVAGGAAAVAVKTGIFKWVWKGLVIGVLAIVASVRRLFVKKPVQPVSPQQVSP